MATHFVETPSLFLPTTLIGIITGKYEMMAGKRTKKRKKSRCSNDGDFGLRGRRFWRDENDGDSVPMTESWQVCIVAIKAYGCSAAARQAGDRLVTVTLRCRLLYP